MLRLPGWQPQRLFAGWFRVIVYTDDTTLPTKSVCGSTANQSARSHTRNRGWLGMLCDPTPVHMCPLSLQPEVPCSMGVIFITAAFKSIKSNQWKDMVKADLLSFQKIMFFCSSSCNLKDKSGILNIEPPFLFV